MFLLKFSSIFIIILQIILNFSSLTTTATVKHAKSFDFGAPMITPHDAENFEELTLSVGDHSTLLCESKDPITWRLPEGFQESANVEHDISYLSTDIDHPFKSKLILKNVNYLYVGEYYCLNNDTNHIEILEDIKKEFKASRIYIYVDDPEYPLVQVDYPMVTAIQFSEAIIPCKPTSKSVDVQLIKDDEESHHINSIYDPAIGFKVKMMHISDGGTFTCQVRKNSEHTFHIEVVVNPGTDYVNKPNIQSATGGYGTQGEDLILNCTVEVHIGVIFSINWSLPNGNLSLNEGRTEISVTTKLPHPSSSELSIGLSSIKINKLDRSKDDGYYKCQVVDHSGNKNNDQLLLTVLDSGQGSLEIAEQHNIYRIEISRTKSEARWLVHYKGHPAPELTWYNNRDEPIIQSNQNMLTSNKYDVTMTMSDTTLRITHLELTDTGNYTLRAYNGILQVEKNFELIVKDKPSVRVNDVYVKPGEQANLICECAGYPPSIISWSYTPCSLIPHWPSCDVARQRLIKDHDITEVTPMAQKSELKFIPEYPGRVVCTARNAEGNDSTNATVKLGDLNDSFEIWRNSDDPIAAGDNVTLYCGALAYDYSADILWYHDNQLMHSSDDILISDHVTEYSYRKTITWKTITISDTGTYECRASLIDPDDTITNQEISIDVLEPKLPEIIRTNLYGDKTMKKSLGEPLRLECEFRGVPTPTIQWYKDDVLIEVLDGTNETRIELYDRNEILDIRFLKSEDEGTYKCEATNRIGRTERTTLLKISNVPAVSKPVIIGIAALIAILVGCTLYLCYRVRKARKLLKELKAAGLANFEEGDIDRINYEQGLDEQAELLPYDKKYEFPKEKLKLGKQLGAGAFGVVVKATATGILPYEDETTVAVKMVKKTADNEVMKALISELKIMVHLGQHLNVVNLLGAITKNIAKREVMVIVEYCRYGNVQHFLIKHRNYFIDQIIRETDTIDATIQTQQPRWSNDSGYEINSQGLKYIKLSFSNNVYCNNINNKNNNNHNNNINNHNNYTIKNNNDNNNHVNVSGNNKLIGQSGGVNSRGYTTRKSAGLADYFPGGMDTGNTDATLISTVPTGDERDSVILSNNSVQPAWRSNYRMDYKGPLRDITTTDLICWSFQVARGMDYLSSRKVLHGDLAARNILLCDDNVVKICDFGLARSMYKSDNYKKKGEAPLPFKWLAIESIGDQVFSTYSDIWSFGIVMWELFSLGKVPYPGMEADQGLYFKLKDGYRMEKPEYATQEIYDIMLQCWSAHAESRPLFSILEKKLGKLLENGVADHYIDLNEPYLQMNMDQFSSGQTDYLGIMAPPDMMAPSIPHYINSGNIATISNSEIQNESSPNAEYLQMNTRSLNALYKPNGDDNNYLTNMNYNNSNTNNNMFPKVQNNASIINENLNQSPTNKSRKPAVAEEVPMLIQNAANQQNSSDSETESISPAITTGPTTPSVINKTQIGHQQKIPKQLYNSPDIKPSPRNLINTSNDNYVNVPSIIQQQQQNNNTNKPLKNNLINTNHNNNNNSNNNNKQDAFSNPAYVVVGKMLPNETRT